MIFFNFLVVDLFCYTRLHPHTKTLRSTDHFLEDLSRGGDELQRFSHQKPKPPAGQKILLYKFSSYKKKM